MDVRPGLYNILLAYADKAHAPYVDGVGFINFVERYAQKYAGEQPEWARWARGNMGKKIWEELGALMG